MKRSNKLAVILSLSIAAAGCASSQMSTGSISPIKAQADDFKVTVAEGAIAGALIGGLAGALTGNGDSERIVQGALIGGAIGAAGGYVIAGQKQQYANQEDALAAVAADSEQRNAKLASILSTTDQVIARRRTELEQLKTSTASSHDKKNAQKALLSELQGDKDALDQAIASAREHGQQIDQNIVSLKQQFPDDRSSTLDNVAGTYKRNAMNLEQKPSEIHRMIEETSRIQVAS